MGELQIATNGRGKASFSEEDLAGMLMSLRGRLIRPGYVDYNEARKVYNGTAQKQPGAIIRARTTGDLVEAVRFAAANDLVLAVRGGGHSVAGKSICDGGFVIDMSGFRGVYLDRRTQVVAVQGGATWGDVDAETEAFGLAVPGGIVSETGVARPGAERRHWLAAQQIRPELRQHDRRRGRGLQRAKSSRLTRVRTRTSSGLCEAAEGTSAL